MDYKIKYPTLLLLFVLSFFSTRSHAQPSGCLASFFANTNGCPTIVFVDQSTPGSSPIQSYTWTFGDGGFTTGPNPTHTYTAGGTYHVCHSIYAQDLCTSTFCEDITVTCLPTGVEAPATDGVLRLRSNPVTDDRLELVLPEKMAGKLALELYAAGGTLLQKWETVCATGDCELEFPREAGVYMLRVTGKNGVAQVLRILKM